MKRPPRSFILLVLLALLGALLYLGYSLRFGFVGFPLDDAWIHQTYARNLALHHQLAYNPGQPSVGSTSPLWSVLVTPAYGLPLEYRFWTYLLGAILLALTGWITYRLASALFPEDSLTPILAGAFCVLEWHLAWAAFSGMETVLFVFLSILAIERYVAGGRPFLIGVVTGLLTLTRPEGVLLLALLILDTLLRRKRTRDTLTWAQAVTSGGFLLLGFLVLITPYLILNVSLTGNLFPNRIP
jgi:Gpi18-like mannosyltransferase